jgi:hypothetical protein
MRIAKPLLLVTTPIAIVIGVCEAFRLAGGLAFLMIALLLMVSAAMGMLVVTIRKEQRVESKTSSAEGTVATREIS